MNRKGKIKEMINILFKMLLDIIVQRLIYFYDQKKVSLFVLLLIYQKEWLKLLV